MLYRNELIVVIFLFCFADFFSSEETTPPTTATQRLIPNGSQQLYDFANEVIIKSLKKSNHTTHIFSSKLKITSVWHSEREQLLQIYVSEPYASETTLKAQLNFKQISEILAKWPFYIRLVDGKPINVISHMSQDNFFLKTKREIASLFQLQFVSEPVSELDISGLCTVFYDVKSPTEIEKSKTNCSYWSILAGNPKIQHSVKLRIHFDLSAQGELLKAESIELVRVLNENNPDADNQINSTIRLKHSSVGSKDVEQFNYLTLDEAVESLLDSYIVFDIDISPTLKGQLAKHASQLRDDQIAQEKLATIFAEIMPFALATRAAEIIEILNEEEDIHLLLVDFFGFTQSIEAYWAINAVFKYDREEDTYLLKKYLHSLSIGSNPKRAIIEDLFLRVLKYLSPSESGAPLIENNSLRKTVLQTIITLTLKSDFLENDFLLHDICKYIIKELDDSCEENDKYCRAFKFLCSYLSKQKQEL